MTTDESIKQLSHTVDMISEELSELKKYKLFKSYESFENMVKQLNNLESKIGFLEKEIERANNNTVGLGKQFIEYLKNNSCRYHADLDKFVTYVEAKAKEIKNIVITYGPISLRGDLTFLLDSIETSDNILKGLISGLSDALKKLDLDFKDMTFIDNSDDS